jgi:hypothetical protein
MGAGVSCEDKEKGKEVVAGGGGTIVYSRKCLQASRYVPNTRQKTRIAQGMTKYRQKVNSS